MPRPAPAWAVLPVPDDPRLMSRPAVTYFTLYLIRGRHAIILNEQHKTPEAANLRALECFPLTCGDGLQRDGVLGFVDGDNPPGTEGALTKHFPLMLLPDLYVSLRRYSEPAAQ